MSKFCGSVDCANTYSEILELMPAATDAMWYEEITEIEIDF